jgi:ankyrin repeat protein
MKTIFMENDDGNLPFHTAVIHGSFEAVKMIASFYDKKHELRNFFGFTPLHLSINLPDKSIFKFLLTYK